MKIVVLDGYTENPGDLSWEELGKFGDLTVYDRTPEDQIAERIGDAQVVYVNKTPITADTIRRCHELKFIGVLATGYNIVDVEAAKQAGVVVSNIPSYGTDAVAQYVFALLLELCHHVWAHSESVKAGEWTASADWCYWKYPLVELAGKTMGVIGLGRIGKRVAEIAEAFGMAVLAYDENRRPELETEKCRYTGLDELLAKSDVISLHCPLFPSTAGMINRAAIDTMKDGVILINTSRGPLIVEEDLREALERGKVGAAAVDVVSQEPIRADNPLMNAKNMVITPHIAWAPIESRQRLMDIAVDNLKCFLDGSAKNVVN